MEHFQAVVQQWLADDENVILQKTINVSDDKWDTSFDTKQNNIGHIDKIPSLLSVSKIDV